ncbi:oxalurate catabolism protein HpxZ [Gluconacetobacter entanii]|uniref:Oxalurate catabolism protein HpxZ n=1 Tax=Gluconacetobacter entanii TaxID=108528 RepID=A0ABT3K720_9PROT|nr:oxalurate catabolism protein HpxZ [Gluconacetobacter entanii]MCW4591220.1 oxalurate catabolism protein HpxZ [Gluconacetobacter entanii]MCW4595462.1 oxalurate catabolism protein HpxZ [Gluconacetobacter entanii]NPC88544.1 oxalurate catabolism protein HpxZ [Gluconacetobacter entanii]
MPELNNPAIVAEVTAMSDLYEQALAENRIATLDGLFYDGPETVRYGVGENLYGAAEIAAFRRTRTGGSPPRRVLRRVITALGPDVATVDLEFQRTGSTRIGRQSQTWIRTDDGWKVIAAHVSLMADIS